MSSVEEGAVYSKIRQEKLSHSTPQSSPERFADSVMKLHPLLQVLAFLRKMDSLCISFILEWLLQTRFHIFATLSDCEPVAQLFGMQCPVGPTGIVLDHASHCDEMNLAAAFTTTNVQ